MKNLPIIAGAVLLLGGCATWQGEESDGIFGRNSGPTRIAPAETAAIAKAKVMLAKGDAPGATKVLKAVCSGKGVPGVTDEALFRLALLTLRPTTEMTDSKEGRQLLQRLKNEYPQSPWTVQASPLIDFLAAADRVRQQSRNLKAANRSLSRGNQSCARDQRMLSEKNRSLAERNQTLAKENRSLSEENIELNNIIEQLKHLDLELDQKTR